MEPISVAIRGETKQGKSTAALSFPRPVLFDFDLRTAGVPQGVMDQVVRHHKLPKPVFVPHAGQSRRVKLEGWTELYDRFVTLFAQELAAPDVDSIIIDTSTQMREMVNRCVLQEKQENQTPKSIQEDGYRDNLIQIEYGEPNNRIASILQAPRLYGKNLVLTHYEEDLYQDIVTYDQQGKAKKESVPVRGLDGKVVRTFAGYNKTENLVDLVVYMTGAPWFEGEVRLSGLAIELLGMKLRPPLYDNLISTLAVLRPGVFEVQRVG